MAGLGFHTVGDGLEEREGIHGRAASHAAVAVKTQPRVACLVGSGFETSQWWPRRDSSTDRRSCGHIIRPISGEWGVQAKQAVTCSVRGWAFTILRWPSVCVS